MSWPVLNGLGRTRLNSSAGGFREVFRIAQHEPLQLVAEPTRSSKTLRDKTRLCFGCFSDAVSAESAGTLSAEDTFPLSIERRH
jgi:hypothetical protein